MRLWAVFLCVMFASLAAPAQADSAQAANPVLTGTVVKEPGGEPLKKAILELIQSNSESPRNYTATSDAEGHFAIHDIVPGQYILMVERTGFLAVDAKRHKADVTTLTFERGQAAQDLLVRMVPAAVVTGRVLDEDGDPMPGASVAILRRHASGPGHSDQVGAERTNDLGQYRISNLLPGRYLVMVTPPVTFESMLAAPKDKDAASKTELSYVTTYYPNTLDRSQASPIELSAGDEIPLDFSLSRVPTAHIRGTLPNFARGSTAMVALRSGDNSLSFTETDVDRDGKFELHHVAPGTYTLLALESIGDRSLIARHTLTVSGVNVDGIRLVPTPETDVRGRARIPENPGFDMSRLILNLRLVDADAGDTSIFLKAGDEARVKPDGSFEFKDVPPGSYYIEAVASREELRSYYLDSVTVSGRDVRDSALIVAGSPLLLDVVLSAKGAKVGGIVVNDHDQAVANAVVVAIPPESLRKRIDRIEQTRTDQQGRFTLEGLIPGNYSLLAWESLDEIDTLTDPDFIRPYQDHAVGIRAEKGGQARVSLKVLPAPDE